MGTELRWDGVFQINIGLLEKDTTGFSEADGRDCAVASSANLAETDLKLNDLPDLDTISSRHIPSLSFIPVIFWVRSSELITSIIDACISHAQSLENWKTVYAISQCVLLASNRGGKNHKQQQQEKQLLSRLERWKSGDYGALWYEAASMKQSSKTSNESIDALASRAKSLCLQEQLGRAAKVLSSDDVAPDNAATLNELRKLKPKEKQPHHQFDQDANTNAYQFDEASVFFPIELFSKFIVAGPSGMYPEHLLHDVYCGAPDQSKRAITSLTKFVNLASRGELPEFVAHILCSATLTALKKLKGGVRPIAVGEVIRGLIAKCIVREANSEAVAPFNTTQLSVAVNSGAESIVHVQFRERSKVLEAVAKILT